jgi:hypothetical protein
LCVAEGDDTVIALVTSAIVGSQKASPPAGIVRTATVLMLHDAAAMVAARLHERIGGGYAGFTSTAFQQMSGKHEHNAQ